MSLEIKPGGDASPRYPVARPAPKAPKIKQAEPEQGDVVEDLLSPPSIKSFAWSIAGHSALLLLLAFWYFSPPAKTPKVFDTRLAGSEFGDPSSDQLTGGLGMDPPLAMPEAAAPALAEVSNTITSLPVAEITPTDRASTRPRTAGGAANGGGVNLTNPGQGGNGDGFGVAKFGNGGENINGVDVKVGDPQFTLIWDSRADIDLHVVEPGGSEIYWENKNGAQGGELDVDDVDGFGPENCNYALGKGPPGSYRWFVHYYGGLGGVNQPTRWKVRVKHAGQIQTFQGKFNAIGQKSQVYSLKVAPDDARTAANSTPRDTPEGGRIVEPPAGSPAVGAASSGPRLLAPPGSGFSVALPSEPKAGRKDWETPLGPVVAQVYSLDLNEGGLSLASLDFPAATLAKADPGKLLDDLALKAIAESRGTPSRQAKIALSGSAGRETDFTVPDSIVAGGGVGKARVYLSGARVFIVSAVGTKWFVEGPEADGFFKSFQLTDAK